MIGRTAVVVDSSAYLPGWLVEKNGLIVVPLSVELDGETYREGLDITPDEFFQRAQTAKSVTTSQPSVGAFIEAYEKAAAEGAEGIISIHIGSSISGTVQSATLAAESAPVPVTVVDTGQASFAEGLCCWAAIDALAAGGAVEQATAAALAASPRVGNTFVVRALDLPRRGGRLAAGQTDVAGVPVMALTPEGMKVVSTVASVEEAVDAMAARIEARASGAEGLLRVGVGHGAAPEIAAALKQRVEAMQGIERVADYIVGPVIGAHTGPGTAGAVWVPVSG